MLAFRYVSKHYLRYFAVIMGALILFVLGFDYIDNAEKFSQSANLVLIYFVYKAFYAVDLLLPLSLIFAMIATKIYLIRSNALVSFFSLGYSRVDILKPFVYVSTAIILLFIALHSWSSFSRAQEFSRNILKHSQYLNPTRDLFFSYEGKYVYFSKLLPLQERAEGVRIFRVDNGALKEVISAKSAAYRDGYWRIQKGDIIQKPDDLSFTSPGITIKAAEDLEILKGFRPKILDQVYEGKVNFTIGDAVDAISLLHSQNIDISTIKSALYKIFVYPFFVPFLIVIIYFFVPISVRFLNVSLFSFVAILTTLLVWGIMMMLIELSNNKTIASEVGIVAPIVILALIALRQWRKYRLATE
jgi:lipopolysaccharide export system permease protein